MCSVQIFAMDNKKHNRKDIISIFPKVEYGGTKHFYIITYSDKTMSVQDTIDRQSENVSNYYKKMQEQYGIKPVNAVSIYGSTYLVFYSNGASQLEVGHSTLKSTFLKDTEINTHQVPGIYGS